MGQRVKEVFKKEPLDAKRSEYGKETFSFMLMLQRFAEGLSQTSDPAQLCGQFVKIIIEETSFENCSILLWDYTKNRLALVAAYGLEDRLDAGSQKRHRQTLCFSFGQGISGEVFSSRRPVFVENAMQEPIPELKGAAVMPISLVCIPLLHLGVLNVSAFHPQTFPTQLQLNWEVLGNIIGYFIIGLKNAWNARREGLPEPGGDIQAQEIEAAQWLEEYLEKLDQFCLNFNEESLAYHQEISNLIKSMKETVP